MVAKDYPFYLTVKRVNLTVEVKTARTPTKEIEEPSTKRVKPLSRVTSLANLIPPVKPTPLKRFSQSLQRSISFRSDSRPDLFTPRPWSRNAPPPITKRRDSKLWSETFDVCVNQVLTSQEIKRQETIKRSTVGIRTQARISNNCDLGAQFEQELTQPPTLFGIFLFVTLFTVHTTMAAIRGGRGDKRTGPGHEGGPGSAAFFEDPGPPYELPSRTSSLCVAECGSAEKPKPMRRKDPKSRKKPKSRSAEKTRSHEAPKRPEVTKTAEAEVLKRRKDPKSRKEKPSYKPTSGKHIWVKFTKIRSCASIRFAALRQVYFRQRYANSLKSEVELRGSAIFELSQGEEDLIEDLKLAKKAYHDPMLKLSIMTEQELTQIFGTLDSLIPLHEDLLRRLREVRKPDGSTENVGHILVGWLPCLNSYDSYCSNQVAAKALLDHKKQDHRVQDFLQRCLESPFSRKLDLWNFLDIPRSRLVKYHLLLKEILRHTPNGHQDQQHLEEAINIIQGIVAEINIKTGESECHYYKERLIYLDECQKDPLIDNSRALCCHGELKNNRGAKFHVFLLQDVLVITRTITQNEALQYQVYRQPIPVKDLILDDLQDGEVRLAGSLRGAFSNNERIKNFFRVGLKNGSHSQGHCLQANDTFNKQQWLNCIRQAKESIVSSGGDDASTSDGQLLISANGTCDSQAAARFEQMDQSDSVSDCSMDISETSMDCEQMEQTNSHNKEGYCHGKKHFFQNESVNRAAPAEFCTEIHFSKEQTDFFIFNFEI
ncbi:hypothetical protein XELAEV_18003042mg [Xenopus laevis]|nr:hypothetical protein XELAEV_18003042mg [Xenopus laevis]